MERETGFEPATSSLGIHPYIESKSLARFCCDFLNLQRLAESAFSIFNLLNEAGTRQTFRCRHTVRAHSSNGRDLKDSSRNGPCKLKVIHGRRFQVQTRTVRKPENQIPLASWTIRQIRPVLLVVAYSTALGRPVQDIDLGEAFCPGCVPTLDAFRSFLANSPTESQHSNLSKHLLIQELDVTSGAVSTSHVSSRDTSRTTSTSGRHRPTQGKSNGE